MKCIEIKKYITLPCEDAAPAIRAAIEDARLLRADEILFERGTYNLCSPISYNTDQSAHDAGAKLRTDNEVLILINNFHNLTIRGAVDENGEPATVFAGINNLEAHSLQPAILWVDNCSNLTIQNIKLCRTPNFCSAGRVSHIDEDRTYIEVLEGNPCYDGMATYCMNKFKPTHRELSGESLSYGTGLGTTFSLVKDRTLLLNSAKIASNVSENDILTWHQGARTDFQCFFGNSSMLRLENIRTTNTNGFAMLAFRIHDLYADRIVFKPEGNQYFTAPRDAWKLHKCSGNVVINHLHVEGVRMDGQNVHNNYLFVRERISDTELIIYADYAQTTFEKGSEIEFFKDEKFIGAGILRDYKHQETCIEEYRVGQIYYLSFKKPLPDSVDDKTLALATCFRPDSYICRNSTFVNIAGAGHLLRTPHVKISNCTYRNIMNPGILLGAEFPTHHEGGNCFDVKIYDCEFDNCGFTPRYSAMGCIGIRSEGFETKVNNDIEILNCSFRNSAVGVDIHNAEDVRIGDCTFEGITEHIRTNK